MTIAIDRATGEVVGQVTDCGGTSLLVILTRHGYVTVPASSVRLEVVR